MKKYIFAALIMLATAFGIKAQEVTYDYALLLNNTDGTTVEFEFKYYPVLTFEGDEVIGNDLAHTEAMRCDMGKIPTSPSSAPRWAWRPWKRLT